MALLSSDVTERVYDFITEDDKGRTCEAIPESACKEAPRNFVPNALNGSATKLAEQLASPGLVLPWLLSTIGTPAALTGLLVPVKEAGSLLPQLAVAGRIRGFAKRKWFWVRAGSTQAVLLAPMIPAAVWGCSSLPTVFPTFSATYFFNFLFETQSQFHWPWIFG